MQISGSDEEKRFIRQHVWELRKHPGLKRARFVLLPEAIPGHGPGHIYDAVRNEPNLTSIWTEVDKYGVGIGDPGFHTTAGVKRAWADSARHFIAGGHLKILEDLVCANPFVPPRNRTQDTLDKLERQLRAYRAVLKLTDDPANIGKYIVGGTFDMHDKRNRSMNDDSADAVCMACWAAEMAIDGCLPNFDHSVVPPI